MENTAEYFVFQNAHIDCRKDNSEIYCNATTPTIRNGINKILNLQLIGILIITQDKCKKYETKFISKHITNVETRGCKKIKLAFVIKLMMKKVKWLL